MIYKFSLCIFLLCLLSFACSKSEKGVCEHCSSLEKYDNSILPAGKLSYKAPQQWLKQAASNSMRLEQYKINENSVMSVSSFATNAGGIDANLERWKKQFDKTSMSEPIVKQFNQKSIPITAVMISGTYLESKNPFDPASEKIAHKDWSAYIVVAELAEATWFFKALGPSIEIDAEKKHLDEFVMSLNIL